MASAPPEAVEEPATSEEPSPVKPGGVLSALGGTAAMYAALMGLGHITTDRGPSRNPLSEAWRYGRIARGMGLGFFDRPTLARGGSPAYAPIENLVISPDNASDASISHELGHAKNHRAVGLGPYVLPQVGRLLPTGILAALYSAGAEDPSLVPGALHAALNAPVLIDEALASARALNYMARRDGLRGLAEGTATLLPAFGTYAVSALGPLGIAALRQGLIARDQRKIDEK